MTLPQPFVLEHLIFAKNVHDPIFLLLNRLDFREGQDPPLQQQDLQLDSLSRGGIKLTPAMACAGYSISSKTFL